MISIIDLRVGRPNLISPAPPIISLLSFVPFIATYLHTDNIMSPMRMRYMKASILLGILR